MSHRKTLGISQLLAMEFKVIGFITVLSQTVFASPLEAAKY